MQANPWLTERFWWDATRGTLASDGRQVYLIKDLGGNAGGNRDARQRRSADVPPPRLECSHRINRISNKLFACELKTQGKLKWEVGGPSGEEEPKLAGAFFLGPPLPLQDKLYVLAEIKGEIKLCVLDAATGHLDWSQQLAAVETNIQQDPLRRLVGCSPSFADGVLVCPTSAGAVVAVDIANRSLLWGYLYSRSPQNAQNQVIFRGPVMAFNGDANGESSGTLERCQCNHRRRLRVDHAAGIERIALRKAVRRPAGLAQTAGARRKLVRGLRSRGQRDTGGQAPNDGAAIVGRQAGLERQAAGSA